MAMLNNQMVYVFFNYELFVSNMMWCYRSILHWDDQWMTTQLILLVPLTVFQVRQYRGTHRHGLSTVVRLLIDDYIIDHDNGLY